MSRSGQAPVESAPERGAPLSRPLRIARLLAVLLLALPVLGALALGLLALRLCFGPIEIGWLAHRLAPRTVAGEELRFDDVRLGWQGAGASARSGDGGGALVIGVDALSLRRPGGGSDADAGRVALALAPAPLLRGVLSVERVWIRDATLSLRRDVDGGIVLAGTAPAAGTARGGGAGSVRLDRLREVAIDRLAVSLDDRRLRRGFAATIAEARLAPLDRLATGRLRAVLSVDGHGIPIEADGAPAPGGGGLHWHVAAGTLVPATFAGLLPALAGFDLPLAPSAELVFDGAGIVPVRGTLFVSLGAGTLAVGDGTLPVASGAVTLQVERDGTDGIRARADGMRLSLQPPPGGGTAPSFTGAGTLSLDHLGQPRRIRAALSLDGGAIGFAGIARYWPAGIAAGARRWITGNITDGVATGLHVETALSGDAGWSSLREIRRAGGFDAHGLVMWWLRPMPPLRDMQAHVTFQGSDALLIRSPSAVLPVQAVGPAAARLAGADPRPLAVSDGSMRITGLDAPQQIGDIALTLSGGLGDLLTELANPRLSLLSKHPLSFSSPSGQVRSTVTVQLPLDDNVSIDDVKVSARSVLRGAHLGDVAAGLALDDADLTIMADTGGLTLDGVGAIGGIDSHLHYAMDFNAGAPDQLVEQARVQGTIGPSTLSGLGIDAGDALSGTGGLSLDYRARRDGRSVVRLALDMTGLAVTLPVWSKRPGQAAAVDAAIVLEHGRLLSVGPIHADGPGLSVEGEVSTPRDGPRRLLVRRFLLGRSRGAGEVVFPHAGGGGGGGRTPIRVTAHGPALDLSAIIDAGSSPGPSKPVAGGRPKPPAAPGPAWTADLRFDRVFVGRDTALGGVSAHLENDGRAMARAQVDATAPTPLSLSLVPDGGVRRVAGTAADTGVLLRALGVTDAMQGGAMRLAALLPPPASERPITGTVEIGRFALPDAPFAARLVRDLSIYGWLLAPRSPQLAVDRLVAPFSFRDGVLDLEDARAHAAALGVTMRGAVDLDRQRLDLHGTVVPAWALNQLPGRLPLVGRLLAPEKGGGVVAVTLGIKGPFASPRISVDPLSALAPGFLRKLFFD